MVLLATALVAASAQAAGAAPRRELPLGAEQPPMGDMPSEADAPAPDELPVEAAAPEAPSDEALPDGFSGVTGRIVDSETRSPLEGALVEVVAGGSGQARTDRAGRYRLPLQPGRYQLRVYYPIYQMRRIRNVVVAGGPRAIDVELRQDDGAIEQILVLAEPERRTEAGLLQIRKRSASVSDSLSAQEMSRSTDSAASDAAKRVVSVTVEEGRYVLVPGLGDRYVTTLLNRAPLPSTEPDRQAVPLDLFPTSLLANLSINKSYSAEHPASFAGGTLLIESSDYPDDLTIKLKVGTSGDTETVSGDAPTYEGGGLDYVGYDDGTRALPDSVPRDRPAVMDRSSGLDAGAMEDIGESFDNTWAAGSRGSSPNLSAGATVGDSLPVGGGEIGYIGTLSFAHKNTLREAARQKISPRPAGQDGFDVIERRRSVKGTERGSVGALGATGWKPNTDHAVDLFAMYVHEGEDVSQVETGASDNSNAAIEGSRFVFVERSMAFGQVASRHRLRQAGDLELRWQGNASRIGREEPDSRNVFYEESANGNLRLVRGAGTPERFFSSLEEDTIGTSLDASLPLGLITLGAGGAAQRAERTFAARRFAYLYVNTSDTEPLFLPPDQIFSPEQIGPNFRIDEQTHQTDAYQASQWIAGGYTTAAVELGRRLRVFGGVRYEATRQELAPGTPHSTEMASADDDVDRSDQDWVPSASAVLAVTDEMNLRTAYSYTLARPRFREVAPYLFTDYTRGINISGNADLLETRIHNADLRWEWFTGDADVIAASLFFKEFRNPIELTIVSASGDLQFVNAAGASAAGAELEGRVSLERFADSLRGVRLWANGTLSRTRIELREEDVHTQTSGSRPLQGQAPVVINLGASWSLSSLGTEVTALYNLVGRRIEEVGNQGLPNTYREPVHQVDLTASQKLGGDLSLKLGASNLLGQKEVLRQGGIDVYRQSPGVAVSAALEWAP